MISFKNTAVWHSTLPLPPPPKSPPLLCLFPLMSLLNVSQLFSSVSLSYLQNFPIPIRILTSQYFFSLFLFPSMVSMPLFRLSFLLGITIISHIFPYFTGESGRGFVAKSLCQGKINLDMNSVHANDLGQVDCLHFLICKCGFTNVMMGFRAGHPWMCHFGLWIISSWKQSRPNRLKKSFSSPLIA